MADDTALLNLSLAKKLADAKYLSPDAAGGFTHGTTLVESTVRSTFGTVLTGTEASSVIALTLNSLSSAYNALLLVVNQVTYTLEANRMAT